jgi:hypothetical protein
MQNNIEGAAFDLDGTLYPNYRLNIRLIPLMRLLRHVFRYLKVTDE